MCCCCCCCCWGGEGGGVEASRDGGAEPDWTGWKPDWTCRTGFRSTDGPVSCEAVPFETERAGGLVRGGPASCEDPTDVGRCLPAASRRAVPTPGDRFDCGREAAAWSGVNAEGCCLMKPMTGLPDGCRWP